MSIEIKINIKSDPKMLCVLRAAISEVCNLGKFERDECTKIVLAVDEACSNIMRHAYNHKTDQPITATFSLSSKMMKITLHDRGKSVDVKKIKSRKLNEVRPGGLGVHIMKTIMDSVEYKNGTEDGNFLILRKYLPKGK
jgi:serine/threonine-protein kinase RsbW